MVETATCLQSDSLQNQELPFFAIWPDCAHWRCFVAGCACAVDQCAAERLFAARCFGGWQWFEEAGTSLFASGCEAEALSD